jgi:ERCC4-type nuclease
MIIMVDEHKSVIVDDREVRLFDALSRLYPNISASRARLTTGDFHIIHGSDPVMVVERKSRADLRASLLDGRFHSQRSRMVSEYGPDHVGFVIEGGTKWCDPEAGAEVALVVRDRLPVFWSSDVDDTAALIARLVGADLAKRHQPPTGENSVRIATASTGCPAKSLAAMLRCVPGVSARRATTISAKFESMSALAKAIERDRSEAVKKISECRNGAGGSRFGGALAHRVVTCLGSPQCNLEPRWANDMA